MRKRSRHVSVWLTDQEHAHLKEQARRAGLGIDPFIRNLIGGIELRPGPPTPMLPFCGSCPLLATM